MVAGAFGRNSLRVEAGLPKILRKKGSAMKSLSMVGMFLVFGSMTGCVSLKENAVSAPYCAQTKTPVFEPTVTVGEKTTGTASGTQVFGIFWFGPSEFADGVVYNGGKFDLGFGKSAQVKSAAAYNAIKASQADILVGPKYVIEKRDYFFFTTLTATVSGNKGKIESFAQVKNEIPTVEIKVGK